MTYVVWVVAIVGVSVLVGWCCWLDYRVRLAEIEHGIGRKEDDE